MPAKLIALLSIHPRYASKILSGEKRLEFRRSWTSRDVSAIVIYATLPVRRIVGVASVKEVHRGTATSLWRLAQEKGGGVTRKELYEYLRGRKRAFAIEVGNVESLESPVDPTSIFEAFAPPQSFFYLEPESADRLKAAAEGKHLSEYL